MDPLRVVRIFVLGTAERADDLRSETDFFGHFAHRGFLGTLTGIDLALWESRGLLLCDAVALLGDRNLDSVRDPPIDDASGADFRELRHGWSGL